jgi:hypothetical protein
MDAGPPVAIPLHSRKFRERRPHPATKAGCCRLAGRSTQRWPTARDVEGSVVSCPSGTAGCTDWPADAINGMASWPDATPLSPATSPPTVTCASTPTLCRRQCHVSSIYCRVFGGSERSPWVPQLSWPAYHSWLRFSPGSVWTSGHSCLRQPSWLQRPALASNLDRDSGSWERDIELPSWRCGIDFSCLTVR